MTEKGFEACLPGEHTRLSSALALFRATRILARVLQRNYPAATSHELSLQQMSALQAELDEWSDNLPSHLKLTFKQDKPSTDLTGSRSPLLVSKIRSLSQAQSRNLTICQGPRILLHQDSHLPACCRVQPGLEICPCPHRDRRVEQAYRPDRPAFGGEEYVLLILPK